MKRYALALAALLLLAVSTVAYAGQGPKHYVATLNSLNNSGVTGQAKLTIVGDQLQVKLDVQGVEPNKMHMQHIHGHTDNTNATCPPPSADTNNDGIISLQEGLPFYGPVLLPLTPYPTPAASGYDFKETYSVDLAALGPLTNRAIVIHGLTVNGAYDMTVPVACGEIQAANGSD